MDAKEKTGRARRRVMGQHGPAGGGAGAPLTRRRGPSDRADYPWGRAARRRRGSGARASRSAV